MKRQKNNWLSTTYFLPIWHAHTITSSLRYALTWSYRNCEAIYSFEVLNTVRKNSILHVAGFLDLTLIIEKIGQVLFYKRLF